MVVDSNFDGVNCGNCSGASSEWKVVTNFGFSIFTTLDEPYLSLARVAVQSLLDFSEHRIHVTAINGRLEWKHERITTDSVRISRMDFERVCYVKTHSSLTSPFDQTLQMDADMIASPSIDEVFGLQPRNAVFPCGALHPFDPVNQLPIMKVLGVTAKTQPYVHATYLFTATSLPFLMELKEVETWFLKRKRFHIKPRPANFDETLLNVLLWKHRVVDAYTDAFDPYFDYFINPTSDILGTSIMNRPVHRYLAHGQKCVQCAVQTLSQMRKMKALNLWTKETPLWNVHVPALSPHNHLVPFEQNAFFEF